MTVAHVHVNKMQRRDECCSTLQVFTSYREMCSKNCSKNRLGSTDVEREWFILRINQRELQTRFIDLGHRIACCLRAYETLWCGRNMRQWNWKLGGIYGDEKRENGKCNEVMWVWDEFEVLFFVEICYKKTGWSQKSHMVSFVVSFMVNFKIKSRRMFSEFWVFLNL